MRAPRLARWRSFLGSATGARRRPVSGRHERPGDVAQGAVDLGAKLVAVGQVDGRGHGEHDPRDRGPGDRPDPAPEAHDPASRST